MLHDDLCGYLSLKVYEVGRREGGWGCKVSDEVAFCVGGVDSIEEKGWEGSP